MGNNSRIFDEKAHLKNKTMDELDALIKYNEHIMKTYPAFTYGSIHEYNERCKLERAERIGKLKEKL